MKKLSLNTFFTLFLSVLTITIVSAQNDGTRQLLNEGKLKNADLSSVQADSLVSASPISEPVKEKEEKKSPEKLLQQKKLIGNDDQ